MSAEILSKINLLLSSQPQGVIFLSKWLSEHGYSYGLQKRYRKSLWLESVGTGAMKRAGDPVGYEGAIYALQKQAGSSIHPGGRTALAYLGKAHYLELGTKKATVFGSGAEDLPPWFEKNDWDVVVDYHRTSFLPPGLGLTEVELKNFSIKVSGAVRAILECAYLVKENQDLLECYELMENLNNLRPGEAQTLLEECRSVKAKRLFLYLAEKAGHKWFEYLNSNKIDLGSGKRSIASGGVYVDKYRITVPKEMENNDRNNL